MFNIEELVGVVLRDEWTITIAKVMVRGEEVAVKVAVHEGDFRSKGHLTAMQLVPKAAFDEESWSMLLQYATSQKEFSNNYPLFVRGPLQINNLETRINPQTGEAKKCLGGFTHGNLVITRGETRRDPEIHPIFNYLRSDYYPYILLPHKIEIYLRGPQIPCKPILKEPPIPERPPRPELPQIPEKAWDKLTAAASTGAGIIVLIGIIIAEFPLLVITLGIGGVGILAKFTFDSFTYEQRQHHYDTVLRPQYEQEQQLYPQRLKAWEEECRRIRLEFEQKKEHADKEYETQTQAILKLWQTGKDLSFQVQSEPLSQPSQAQDGALDDYFRERIQTRLADIPDLVISVLPKLRGLHIPDFPYPYTPDIAIRASKDGKELFIDVENDEPWYMSNGSRMVHHASDAPKQQRRDHFFRDRGWIVVRFSERQIASQTDKCVRFVSDVIRSVYQPGAQVFRDPPLDHRRWNSSNALEEWRPGEDYQ